jgi:hypothetical protein
MIELVSRKSVFEKLPKIGNEIHLIQKSMYEDCFTDTGYPLTKNQLVELEYEFDYLETNPIQDYDFELIRIKSKIKLPYTKYYYEIARQLSALLSGTKTDTFYIISHLKTDFFYAMKNHFQNKRFRKEYSLLEKKIKLGSYDEAIKIDKSELIDFLEIFNKIDTFGGGIAEYILFCSEDDKFCFYFHYSGSITFWSFKENDFLKESVLNKFDFEILI